MEAECNFSTILESYHNGDGKLQLDFFLQPVELDLYENFKFLRLPAKLKRLVRMRMTGFYPFYQFIILFLTKTAVLS
jgi:hypothetical protein